MRTSCVRNNICGELSDHISKTLSDSSYLGPLREVDGLN